MLYLNMISCETNVIEIFSLPHCCTLSQRGLGVVLIAVCDVFGTALLLGQGIALNDGQVPTFRSHWRDSVSMNAKDGQKAPRSDGNNNMKFRASMKEGR
jgi:hypothetical protein